MCNSLRLKIPPFEKARTVLEALKEQEQERRKKVGNSWCFHRLRKQQASRQMPEAGVWLPMALHDELCQSSALRKSTSVFGVGEEEEVRETLCKFKISKGKAAVKPKADCVALGERKRLF